MGTYIKRAKFKFDTMVQEVPIEQQVDLQAYGKTYFKIGIDAAWWKTYSDGQLINIWLLLFGTARVC